MALSLRVMYGVFLTNLQIKFKPIIYATELLPQPLNYGTYGIGHFISNEGTWYIYIFYPNGHH